MHRHTEPTCATARNKGIRHSWLSACCLWLALVLLPALPAAQDTAPASPWLPLEPGLFLGEFPLDEAEARLTVLRIDPRFFDFVLCSRSQDNGPVRTLSQWGEEYDLAAAINASMYLPDDSTSTGYMRQGAHVNNGRIVQRFGAFFVAGPTDPQLPGAAILDRDNPRWRELLDKYALVIQNYRMTGEDRRVLWSPGGPHYAISAVAQNGEGHILFLHCHQPVDAHAFARQILHLPLNARTVMYVEGGAQAGLLVRSATLKRELGGISAAGFLVTGNLRAAVPNVLGVQRKAGPAPAASGMHGESTDGEETDSPARETPQNPGSAQP